jgi:hypothetical protein
MIWNEHAQKWLMQKYSDIMEDWVFIYDFWDCGTVKTMFGLHKKTDKERATNYIISIAKEVSFK